MLRARGVQGHHRPLDEAREVGVECMWVCMCVLTHLHGHGAQHVCAAWALGHGPVGHHVPRLDCVSTRGRGAWHACESGGGLGRKVRKHHCGRKGSRG
jgi:hypothetical protein